MKKGLHPEEYRVVVVQDTSNNTSFLTRSTAQTFETIKWQDGNTYPLVKVHISSTSHPFYTGKEKLVDIEGRVDKFEARREAAAKMRADFKKKTTKTKKAVKKSTDRPKKISNNASLESKSDPQSKKDKTKKSE
jgi:large subunit ribosomal protein L31